MNNSLVYRVALTLLEGVGNRTAKKLVAYFGGVDALFEEKQDGLPKVKIPGLKQGLTEQLLHRDVLDRAKREIAFIEQHGIRPLFYLDADYPKRLKHCEDGPVMLYTKGEMDLNVQKTLAIVGTRKASEYGKKICRQVIEALSQHNLLIISGLAYGIDICAHDAALKNGLQTVAVLGHGLDRIYPAVHRKTVMKMMACGGLATEFLSGTKPERENFPQRNRIIAGMADATLVIESGLKGGSMITASIAGSYNRDVFALPGRSTDPASAGCNYLIKSNRAAMVESAEDIEREMGWQIQDTRKSVQQQLFADLSPEEQKLVSLLREKGKTGIDEIALLMELPMSKVAALLLELEFKGVVRALPGKIFEHV